MDTSNDNLSISNNSDLMRSFGEYSSSSTEIWLGENESEPSTSFVMDILNFRATNNTSFKAAEDFAKKINQMPGAQIELPTSQYLLKKEANLKFNFDHYIICDKCKYLNKTEICQKCELKTKKRKNNYFIYIPVKQQIKFFLQRYQKEIVEFMRKSKKDNDICDFDDGEIYKKIKGTTNERIILPLTLNVDGGKIFNSSSCTLWPIQLLQLYLPPQIRYLTKNILVVGLYCAAEKPNLAAIMEPFAQEMNELSVGLNLNYENDFLHLLPEVNFCSCDLPARVEMQSSKHISGYNACPCCEHPGQAVQNSITKRKYVRYLAQKEPSPMRNHKDIVEISYEMYNGNAPSDTKGLKKIPIMIAFKNFDLVNGFVTDWMHGSLLGVMKLLLDIWFGTHKLCYTENEKKKYEFSALSKKKRIELDKRIMNLKPYHRLNHKPRSIIEKRAFFGANEYRNLLWFYLKFAIFDILPSEIVKHFELFSAATYMLAKDRISQAEIKIADEMLQQFANQFELYYGTNSITMNVHLLRHYATMVAQTGPLWTHSLFCFESNMGRIKRSFKTKVDVVKNIAFNYCLADPNTAGTEAEVMRKTDILDAKDRTISKDIRDALIDSEFKSDKYLIGTRMKRNRTVYTSTLCNQRKSIDSFVRLKSGLIGEIVCFIKSIGDSFIESHALINVYNTNKFHYHLTQIAPANKYLICRCADIGEQLIYLKYDYSRVAVVELVATEPNYFEGN